jgi:hypothetical protein
MKSIYFQVILVSMVACNQPSPKIEVLRGRIDSLELKVADAYKPGFGEFMGNIQVHHNKLWFAGQNENWKLAGFELHEISTMLATGPPTLNLM